MYKRQDSYHAEAIAPASPADHTRGLIEVLKNPDVDCLGHIGNPVFQCDYEAVIKACAQEEKLIEINSNSFIAVSYTHLDVYKRQLHSE